MGNALRGVQVREVMDPPPPQVGATMAISGLIDQHMLGQNIRAVPVQGADGRLLGLVTLQDIRHVPRDDWDTTPVTQAMTRASELRTVSPDADLQRAMAALTEGGYNQLPVLDDGRLVGMLSRAHVLQYLHQREQLKAIPGGDRSQGARRVS
jgi:CBS domain-containing protein